MYPMRCRLPRLLSLQWSVALLVTFLGAPHTPSDSPIQVYLPLIARQPAPVPTTGIWITQEGIARLPMTGPAWTNLQATADENAGTPTLRDQDADANVKILAKALVYARTKAPQYRTDVCAALAVITQQNTEENGRVLALGRELAAYVIAADLIDLAHFDPALDGLFRAKLRTLLTKPLEAWSDEPRSLQETHALRPNNWGTHAGASRLAVALYLGDTAEIEQSALIFRGYLGDLAAYNSFDYGDDLSWQADPLQPVGLNPVGATKDGHSIDGALPEEMRRGAIFQWPPVPTNYPWEALQGVVVQATLLQRAGYSAWEWQDRAVLRAVQFLYNIGWPATGDDEWIIPLINCVYHTTFPAAMPAHPGKNMGWTSWTHPQCS
jgi:hypothetical protein